MKCDDSKYKVLPPGLDNPCKEYSLKEHLTERSPVQKDLVVLMDEMLKMNWQCALTIWKDNHILGCIKRSVATNMRMVILSLSGKVPTWSPAHSSGAPNIQHDMDLLERVQMKPMKMISGLKHFSYGNRLRGLELFSL
ncbi:hypothetical protein HGM15179_018877 [Zosterops borbonicus]|uniref:Uncharacterized protein n=1 Tax=Zosterops borbonicus TaxID=364589 RepID=A0A8K1FYD5_9PASS|nr:hypothetical protein HGM15179_018877 [Zosterops borbonicus]